MSYFPTVVASLFGGVLVDRAGFKRASVTADLASGATVAMIPLLSATIGLEFWQLLVLVFLGSLLDAPGTIAREALIPRLAAEVGMPLERATSAIQVIERTSRVVGAPLAGVLIAVTGAAAALWIDAATFVVSGAVVAFFVTDQRTEPRPPGRYRSEFAEGMRFLWRDGVIRWVSISVMVTNLLDTPVLAVLIPVYANRVLESSVALGLMLGASGGGAVVGALLFAWLGLRVSRRVVFAAGFLFVGLPYWILATLPPLPVAVAALFFHGLAAGPLNPVIGAVQFERIPEHLRGRVFGASLALSWMTIPVGTILAGWLVDIVGIRAVFAAIAAAYLAWTIGIAINPVFRRLDETRAGPSNPAGPL